MYYYFCFSYIFFSFYILTTKLFEIGVYEKYILSEVRNSGLANRINCISSSLLMSIITRRKMLSIIGFYNYSLSF